MTATEEKSMAQLISLANTRDPGFRAIEALQAFVNERDSNRETMARIIFQEAQTTRLRAKLAGPLRRRNYLQAASGMLVNATAMTEDAELLKAIAEESRIVADLLKAEFQAEKQALEEEQTRMLMMLQGTWKCPKRTITTEDSTQSITDESGLALNPES